MLLFRNDTIIFAILTAVMLCSCNPSPAPPAKDTVGEHDALQLSGTIIGYEGNREGDIDKLLFRTNTDSVRIIHFPPHTAKALLAVATNGTDVNIGISNALPPHEKQHGMQYELVWLKANNNAAEFRPHNLPPLPPSAGKEVSLHGSFQLKTDDNNGTYGYVQENKLVVLPPHAREALQSALQKASTIATKGYERDARAGFVNIEGKVVVRPYQVTINGVGYDVR